MSYLGIDVGTGGTRALVMDSSGNVIASASSEHQDFASPKPGWAEQDPRDWWRACGVAVRQALQSAKLDAKEISCVGFSGQMHGAVLLDSSDEVVRPALIWCDQRSDPQSRELEQMFGRDALIRLTCNPPLTNFTLTKFLWVRENEPQNWARVAHVMLPKDYVRFRLTGERAIDMADASGTLLLDVSNRRWSAEVLNKTDIKESLLPALFESPQVCGKISAAGAEATGLKAGTPVVAGAGDQAAGAVGMGIARAGAVSVKETCPIFEKMKIAVTSIRLGGGGARSPLWLQILADVSGREVEIVAAEEGAAYGAAILAGVGAGAWSSVEQACDAVVRVAKRIQPNAKDSATMQLAYTTYRKIYAALKFAAA